MIFFAMRRKSLPLVILLVHYAPWIDGNQSRLPFGTFLIKTFSHRANFIRRVEELIGMEAATSAGNARKGTKAKTSHPVTLPL